MWGSGTPITARPDLARQAKIAQHDDDLFIARFASPPIPRYRSAMIEDLDASQKEYTDADISAVMREMGRKGRAARWARTTPAQRAELARKLVVAREKKRKKNAKLLKTKAK